MTLAIIVNLILLLFACVLLVSWMSARSEADFQKRRAASFEKQANDSFAFSTKVQRDNYDLRTRLREQGKAWSAKVRKARRQ